MTGLLAHGLRRLICRDSKRKIINFPFYSIANKFKHVCQVFSSLYKVTLTFLFHLNMMAIGGLMISVWPTKTVHADIGVPGARASPGLTLEQTKLIIYTTLAHHLLIFRGQIS